VQQDDTLKLRYAFIRCNGAEARVIWAQFSVISHDLHKNWLQFISKFSMKTNYTNL